MLKSLSLVLTVAATPLAAQDLVYDFTDSKGCVANGGDWYDMLQCIGVAAANCMDNSPQGHTTIGTGACLWAEHEDWDRELNAVYGPLIEALARDDETYGEPVSMAEALRDAQRSWIAYRDAACHFERSKWGAGTGGGPAQANCLMRMTAERAITLQLESAGR
ncbi:lysozyme inhibitor LprI family protein [Maritimibacter sp. DP1N21-5]|uniref:lysozyme inhibitor LprI family protein n=1 Tax=Maritimibacter sp. DP1N21-5 TaxID=2836867 RepID=UPI001C4657DC|nr:lysozyme inhibitor LprI family protein [Maritimibacter sp. DP1N21-5]MBV7409433.1 DUF1311 domain-containing protein [Maritimibacter sp. DP1N21-5]